MVFNGMCPSKLFSNDYFLKCIFECCSKTHHFSTDRKLPLFQRAVIDGISHADVNENKQENKDS